jgi:nicotinate phosphoribosyltransferase
LGGVYKLVAVCQDQNWVPALKISESPSQTPNPGNKHVWRIYDQRGKASADLLSLEDENPEDMDAIILRHPMDHTKYRTLPKEEISEIEALHIDILEEGKVVYDQPGIDDIRQQRMADVERLDPGVRRIMYPHIYHVSLTQSLWDLKQDLIEAEMRGANQSIL